MIPRPRDLALTTAAICVGMRRMFCLSTTACTTTCPRAGGRARERAGGRTTGRRRRLDTVPLDTVPVAVVSGIISEVEAAASVGVASGLEVLVVRWAAVLAVETSVAVALVEMAISRDQDLVAEVEAGAEAEAIIMLTKGSGEAAVVVIVLVAVMVAVMVAVGHPDQGCRLMPMHQALESIRR